MSHSNWRFHGNVSTKVLLRSWWCCNGVNGITKWASENWSTNLMIATNWHRLSDPLLSTSSKEAHAIQRQEAFHSSSIVADLHQQMHHKEWQAPIKSQHCLQLVSDWTFSSVSTQDPQGLLNPLSLVCQHWNHWPVCNTSKECNKMNPK